MKVTSLLLQAASIGSVLSAALPLTPGLNGPALERRKHSAPGPTTQINGCLEPGCHHIRKKDIVEPAGEPALETRGKARTSGETDVHYRREAKHAAPSQTIQSGGPLRPHAARDVQDAEEPVLETRDPKRSAGHGTNFQTHGKLHPQRDVAEEAVQVPDIVSRPTRGAGGVNFQTHGCLRPGCNINGRDAVEEPSQEPALEARAHKHAAPSTSFQTHGKLHP
ncbi:hypothetical protein LX32DRAFT_642156 [Colletotrichum zoysiae]|uniref:Uncharacterized protein n=1 Tax=Colletotrichum zoysiae TaxID=1216348 RepID=A0AAD9HC02_9PEZI|nr:hypothetical protein LX32DRAFT_642156 [Colletotrichum zoysiae]